MLVFPTWLRRLRQFAQIDGDIDIPHNGKHRPSKMGRYPSTSQPIARRSFNAARDSLAWKTINVGILQWPVLSCFPEMPQNKLLAFGLPYIACHHIGWCPEFSPILQWHSIPPKRNTENRTSFCFYLLFAENYIKVCNINENPCEGWHDQLQKSGPRHFSSIASLPVGSGTGDAAMPLGRGV